MGLVSPFYSDQDPLNANHITLHHIVCDSISRLYICLLFGCRSCDACHTSWVTNVILYDFLFPICFYYVFVHTVKSCMFHGANDKLMAFWEVQGQQVYFIRRSALITLSVTLGMCGVKLGHRHVESKCLSALKEAEVICQRAFYSL